MPGWLKVLLIVLLVIILGVVAIIAAAGFWFYRNKDALVAKTKEIAEDARSFGENTDNQGCVDEMVSRYKADPGFRSAISQAIFVQMCLRESRETPGFCDNVPKRIEFMKSAEWQKDQCRRLGLERDSYCPNLVQPIQNFCEEQTRK